MYKTLGTFFFFFFFFLLSFWFLCCRCTRFIFVVSVRFVEVGQIRAGVMIKRHCSFLPVDFIEDSCWIISGQGAF